jgi:hypothetical protein
MVVGEEACGQNRKTGAPPKLPFNCSQCHDIVNDILQNKLPKEEQARIEFLRSQNDSLAIAVSIEYIAKLLPTAEGNIAETVLAIMVPQYGRECRAVLVDASEPPMITDLFQEHHGNLEQKTRARLAQEKLGALNMHEKRKVFEQSVQTSNSEEFDTPLAADSMDASKIAPTAKNGNKKQVRLFMYGLYLRFALTSSLCFCRSTSWNHAGSQCRNRIAASSAPPLPLDGYQMQRLWWTTAVPQPPTRATRSSRRSSRPTRSLSPCVCVARSASPGSWTLSQTRQNRPNAQCRPSPTSSKKPPSYQFPLFECLL